MISLTETVLPLGALPDVCPEVSIVIVNWNTRDLLRGCLASIQAQTTVPHEVIVVDNASTDGSADMVVAEFPGARLIANTTNHGFAGANNQGLAIARGVIRAHQGEIRVESTEGVGTEFIVTLPLTAINATLAPQDTPAPASAAARSLRTSFITTPTAHSARSSGSLPADAAGVTMPIITASGTALRAASTRGVMVT